MADINVTPFGAAENCARDNWAAEYAKKLFVNEAADRTADITAEENARKAAVAAEETARKNAVMNLSEQLTQEVSERKLADGTAKAEFNALLAQETAAREGADNAVRTELAAAADTHKTAAVLDHPDGSVTAQKLADGSVGTNAVSEAVWALINGKDEAVSKKITQETAARERADNAVRAEFAAADTALREGMEDYYSNVLSLNDVVIHTNEGGSRNITIDKAGSSDLVVDVSGVLNAQRIGADSLTVYDSGREDWENISYNDVLELKETAVQSHSHDNKAVLDAITADKVNAWDTQLDTFESNGYVGIDEVTNCLNDARNLLSYDSNTPVQIGTWIDGTPIWRYAFDNDFDELELEERYVSKPMPVKDVNKVFIINESCRMRVSSNKNNFIDDLIMVNDMYVYSFPDSTPPLPAGAGYYGYIEFVTPASNIETN